MTGLPTLTIFTPTYNRARLLGRVYDSLVSQDCKDFVWMVVDDGSTDGTEELVQGFERDGVIAIDYRRKENGGKHTAYNLCLDSLETDLVLVAMDSDDLLKPGAVAAIIDAWSGVRDDPEVAGMVFLCEGPDGKPLYDAYDDARLATGPSLQQAIVNRWFYGEAEYVFRTEYAQGFRYPERPGERFFNEAYTYVQMTGRMLWVKKSIYIRDYQNDGLTRNFLSMVMGSPLNYADYTNTMARWTRGARAAKYMLYYDAFSLFAGARGFLRKASHPLAARLLLPAGWAASLGLRAKAARMGGGDA